MTICEKSRNPYKVAYIKGAHSVYTRFIRGGLVNRKILGVFDNFTGF